MEISEATPIDPRIKKEEIFLKNIKKIEELDKLVTDISDLYDQGLSDIAYLRFKNQIFGNSLSAFSYTDGPSLRFIEINEKEGYKLVEGNQQFLHSEDSKDKEIIEVIIVFFFTLITTQSQNTRSDIKARFTHCLLDSLD